MESNVMRGTMLQPFWMAIIAYVFVGMASDGRLLRWPLENWQASTLLLAGGLAGLLGLVFLIDAFKRRARLDRLGWIDVVISVPLLAIAGVRFVRFVL